MALQALHVSAPLLAADCPLRLSPTEDYKAAMLEKLVWISGVMLVGAEHKCTVGEGDSKHRAQVADMLLEVRWMRMRSDGEKWRNLRLARVV